MGKLSKSDSQRLQSLLRTSILGIESYNRLIRDVKAESIVRRFRAYGSDYAEFASEISNVMESHGITPTKSSGTVGAMAGMSYKMLGIDHSDTLRMLEAAYKGEMKSLEKTTKLYAESDNEEVKHLIAKNLAASKRRMEELMKLILSYEAENE